MGLFNSIFSIEEQLRWRSVDKELPEDNKTLLCGSENLERTLPVLIRLKGGGVLVDCRFKCKDKWYWKHYDQSIVEWLPIPRKE